MNDRIDKMIDEALKTEPSFQLRKDFRDRVVHIVRRKEKMVQRRLFLWMALGTLVIFAFGYITVAYFMPSLLETFKGTGNVVNQLIPFAVLLGLIVLIIQYLDKRLIKNRMHFS